MSVAAACPACPPIVPLSSSSSFRTPSARPWRLSHLHSYAFPNVLSPSLSIRVVVPCVLVRSRRTVVGCSCARSRFRTNVAVFVASPSVRRPAPFRYPAPFSFALAMTLSPSGVQEGAETARIDGHVYDSQFFVSVPRIDCSLCPLQRPRVIFYFMFVCLFVGATPHLLCSSICYVRVRPGVPPVRLSRVHVVSIAIAFDLRLLSFFLLVCTSVSRRSISGCWGLCRASLSLVRSAGPASTHAPPPHR